MCGFLGTAAREVTRSFPNGCSQEKWARCGDARVPATEPSAQSAESALSRLELSQPRYCPRGTDASRLGVRNQNQNHAALIDSPDSTSANALSDRHCSDPCSDPLF